MRSTRISAQLASSLALVLAVGLPGCEGDGADGSSPRIVRNSTRECIRFAGGFPSGLTSLMGADHQAAVVQFIPTAILGLDLDFEPPRLLSNSAIPNFPPLPCARCGGRSGVDSDSDGIADICRSDAVGYSCLPPRAGGLLALEPDLVALSTSSYEQLVFFNPRNGQTRLVELDTPPLSNDFDPMDWPFWPMPGDRLLRSALSTRACVYTQASDSLSTAIGPNRLCDDTRNGFATGFTAAAAITGDRLFVATSNLLHSAQARYAPGTVLVFDLDRSLDPARVRPDPTHAVILTSGFNPTTVAPYTTPAGRRLLLVGISGALRIGTGPDLVRTDSAVDVIDAQTRTLIATIPMGRAGLGGSGIAIDASKRIALLGAFTKRQLFGIDLAALDDPSLGSGPQPLPIVLDGTTSGFPDARLYDAANPFVLPKRADGPSEAQCATITSVALSGQAPYAVATDFCDGTISVLDVTLPIDRNTPLEPATVLALDRVETVAAPIVDTSTGLTRAIDRVLVRPGQPGIDFTGPDVYFTAGLPEGAVCGVRIESF